MMRERYRGATALACALLLAGPLAANDKDELKKLEGTWLLISAEANGEQIPKEALKGQTTTLKGETFTIRTPGVPPARGKFKIDPSKSPKQFDWAEEGTKVALIAIYELRGDTLRICSTRAGGKRPTTFSTKGGTAKQVLALSVYRRQKGGEGK
jgi:uncharacterized protein (TIGR03067 family)